jgi:hypothetical protein
MHLETSVNINLTTRCYIPEDSELQAMSDVSTMLSGNIFPVFHYNTEVLMKKHIKVVT